MKSFKTLILAALAAAVFAPGTARAESDLPVGVAQAKNLVERTVTIDDQTYRVTGATRITDLEGLPMPLERVETAADHGGLVRLDAVTYAYDARGGTLAVLKAVALPR